MPSKTKPLTEAQLRAYESQRDLAAELFAQPEILAIVGPA